MAAIVAGLAGAGATAGFTFTTTAASTPTHAVQSAPEQTRAPVTTPRRVVLARKGRAQDVGARNRARVRAAAQDHDPADHRRAAEPSSVRPARGQPEHIREPGTSSPGTSSPGTSSPGTLPQRRPVPRPPRETTRRFPVGYPPLP